MDYNNVDVLPNNFAFVCLVKDILEVEELWIIYEHEFLTMKLAYIFEGF